MKEHIARIREMLAKATPGPWERWTKHVEVFAGPTSKNTPGSISGYRQRICECDEDEPKSLSNARLIAAAPTELARLCSALLVADRALENIAEENETNTNFERATDEAQYYINQAREARAEINKILEGK